MVAPAMTPEQIDWNGRLICDTGHKLIRMGLKETVVPDGYDVNYPCFFLPEGVVCEAMLKTGKWDYEFHKELLVTRDELESLRFQDMAGLVNERCAKVVSWYKSRLEVPNGPT